MKMYIVGVLILSSLVASISPPDPSLVLTAQGKIRGGRMATYTGKPFFAFRGVRYAEAPTGDYRFKVRRFLISLVTTVIDL